MTADKKYFDKNKKIKPVQIKSRKHLFFKIAFLVFILMLVEVALAILYWKFPLVSGNFHEEYDFRAPHRLWNASSRAAWDDLYGSDFVSLNISFNEMIGVSSVVAAIFIALIVLNRDHQSFIKNELRSELEGQELDDDSIQQVNLNQHRLDIMSFSLYLTTVVYGVLVTLFGLSEIGDYSQLEGSRYPDAFILDYLAIVWPGLFHPRVLLFVGIWVLFSILCVTTLDVYGDRLWGGLMSDADSIKKRKYAHSVLGQFGITPKDSDWTRSSIDAAVESFTKCRRSSLTIFIAIYSILLLLVSVGICFLWKKLGLFELSNYDYVKTIGYIFILFLFAQFGYMFGFEYPSWLKTLNLHTNFVTGEFFRAIRTISFATFIVAILGWIIVCVGAGTWKVGVPVVCIMFLIIGSAKVEKAKFKKVLSDVLDAESVVCTASNINGYFDIDASRAGRLWRSLWFFPIVWSVKSVYLRLVKVANVVADNENGASSA